MVGLGIFLFSFFLLPQVWGEEQAYKEFIFAQGLYEDGKFGLAAVQFQKFIEDFPENRNCDRAQYLLGACFWNQEKYEEAISAFDRLLQKYPESDWVDDSLYQVGENYYRLRNYAEAIPYYETLIENYPQSNLIAPSLYSLGYVYVEQKNYEGSLRVFRKLRDEFPEFKQISEVHYIIAKILYDNKRYPEAINEYSTFIRAFPTSKYRSNVYLERGWAYFEEGNYGKARDDFAAVGAFFWLGESLYNLGQFREARKAYEKALEKPEPTWKPQAYYGVAYTYFKEKNYPQAADAFEKYIAAFPDSPNLAESWTRLGDCLYFQNKFSSARESYLTVVTNYHLTKKT